MFFLVAILPQNIVMPSFNDDSIIVTLNIVSSLYRVSYVSFFVEFAVYFSLRLSALYH